MTKLMSCKSLNEKLKELITRNASQEEIWQVCGSYLKTDDLSKEDVYHLVFLHVKAGHLDNKMEETLLDLLDLYSGNCSSECKLY